MKRRKDDGQLFIFLAGFTLYSRQFDKHFSKSWLLTLGKVFLTLRRNQGAYRNIMSKEKVTDCIQQGNVAGTCGSGTTPLLS